MQLCIRDSLLFLFEKGVDLFAHIVSQLLKILFGDLQIVLGDLAGLLLFLKRFHRIASNIADSDLAVLGILMDLLDELLTALLRELREVQANGLAVVLRVDAKVSLLNGALDGLERRACLLYTSRCV